MASVADLGDPIVLGVLDHDEGHLGNGPLADALARGGHGVGHHLFGHVHATAGQRAEARGVRFYNGALGAALVELLPRAAAPGETRPPGG